MTPAGVHITTADTDAEQQQMTLALDMSVEVVRVPRVPCPCVSWTVVHCAAIGGIVHVMLFREEVLMLTRSPLCFLRTLHGAS